jgi:hypothetical protein
VWRLKLNAYNSQHILYSPPARVLSIDHMRRLRFNDTSATGLLYDLCCALGSTCSLRPYVTVVGANLCAPDPLEVKGKGIRGMEGVADKEAYAVHVDIISQWQYFVACHLISYVSNAFGLHSICVCFPSTCKLVI